MDTTTTIIDMITITMTIILVDMTILENMKIITMMIQLTIRKIIIENNNNQVAEEVEEEVVDIMMKMVTIMKMITIRRRRVEGEVVEVVDMHLRDHPLRDHPPPPPSHPKCQTSYAQETKK